MTLIVKTIRNIDDFMLFLFMCDVCRCMLLYLLNAAVVGASLLLALAVLYTLNKNGDVCRCMLHAECCCCWSLTAPSPGCSLYA